MEAIKKDAPRINIAEPCPFIHCYYLMSMAIADIHRKIDPPSKILEKAYKITENRKKAR